MLTEEYVRNLKPQKENKKIEMSVARAKVIAAVLTKNDFENSLKELLEEQFDKHQKEIRRIRTLKYCEHEWHKFTKKELSMHASPRMFGIEDWPEEYIEIFYLDAFSYCEKCGMPFKFITFKDEDFERIIEEYESEDTITVTAQNRTSDFLFERLLEDQNIAIDEKDTGVPDIKKYS